MNAFDYVRPDSLQQALEQLGDGARPLAGGTDLLSLIKPGLAEPDRLLDIKRLQLPRGINETGHVRDGVRIGALTPLSEVERSARLARDYPALTQSVASAATPQLRNRATLGGNLLQRPRCWYYRNPRFQCWLKGGEDCPARHGRNEMHALFEHQHCCAVHPSDPASALLAYDAVVRLQGPGGSRELPLADFLRPPEPGRRTENVLGKDELLLDIALPGPPQRPAGVYRKAMERKTWAFALVGVAAAAGRDADGALFRVRLVASGVAAVPYRLETAERLLEGRSPDSAVIEEAAAAALADARPLSENGYKTALLKGLVKQALGALK